MNNSFLKEGDSGEEVTLLQQMLKINNYFPGSTTGVYGPDTVLYVSNFQKDFNLDVTGNTTQETWEMLYKITEPAMTFSVLTKPTLFIGDEGEEVREVQIILKDLLYYEGEIDGVFDQELYIAVQSFQFLNKLVPDGIVGKSTWSALINLYTPLADCEEGSIPDSSSVYTVKKGDTLYSIARQFNTTVDEIKRLNNLTSNTLSIGQVLKIKEENLGENDYVTYTVKAGDTLYSIARNNNITVDELRKLNNLTSDILSIGQVLKIRAINVEEPDEFTYTVKSGDTLYSIARLFNTTVDEIKRLNNLTSNVLSIGQVLKIRESETEPGVITYTVQSGDTLYSIAARFNTSVNDLIIKNNLTNTILSIGQVLKI